MLATLYDFLFYIYRYYNVWIGMTIYDNYVGILVSTIRLSNNDFILHFWLTLNCRLSQWVYNYSILCIWNPVSGIIIVNNYVCVFILPRYFCKWWFILELQMVVHVGLSLIKNVCISTWCAMNRTKWRFLKNMLIY